MYNNNRRGNSSFGRNRNNSNSGGRSHFSRNRFGGGRPKNNSRSFSKHIDNSMFIKKAEEFVKIEEVATKNTFEDFGLDTILLRNIKNKGYLKPTLIQDEVIKPVLENKDVLGIANTGTGKTAAFVLPLINKILKNPSERIIILAPTRELAMQIKQEIRSFTFDLKVYLAIAIGGAFIREQIIDIRRDPHIIIGTPGRIKDLNERRCLNLSKFTTVVLDEVDRMLDMGFINDIRMIVDQIPKEKRQTLFFSATMDRKIETLIDTFLTDPVKISVKTQDSSCHVEQNVIKSHRDNKEQTLCELLTQPHFKKVLVFGATKMMVERLTNTLIQKGFNADSIHGDKPQHKRQRVLAAFKADQIKILIATDVAARGLDVADITHVINYDKPNNYEDYVHRIGRTGRGNSKGYALTFVEGY